MCCDGPFWDDARMRHGDVTGVLELECRPSTVGGSVGVRKTADLSLLFANISLERVKRFPETWP
ncbi:hypothetical protein T07_13017 [Trichinella nelsoni]|uniref:Uncharacterized protein n=1 Tax=Trichinella nelsoni TaxID=6336 RepID=A0A0V0RHV9_9BILA|nr:hypothetical protein T07_13017 [Trichinella nelsoni]